MENKLLGGKVTDNDVLFVCFIIEKTARTLKQRNQYVVEKLGHEGLQHELYVADVRHCENPLQVVDDWISNYKMEKGTFDILDVDRELAPNLPSELDMGAVYARLVCAETSERGDYAETIQKVYQSPICRIIDNYESSGFCEPSHVIRRAFETGSFN